MIKSDRTVGCWGDEGSDDSVPLLGTPIGNSIRDPVLDKGAVVSLAPYDKGVLQIGGGRGTLVDFFCVLFEGGRIDCWADFSTRDPEYLGELGTDPKPQVLLAMAEER